MGRKSLGELPTVLTTVRVAGEHAAKLTAGGKKLGEAIRELIEREFSGGGDAHGQPAMVPENEGVRSGTRSAGTKVRKATVPKPEVEGTTVTVGGFTPSEHGFAYPQTDPLNFPAEQPGPKRGHCIHGVKRGYRCWQCGGLAKVGGGEPEEPKKKGFKR